MNTELSKSGSTPSKSKERSSKAELDELLKKVRSRFDDMSEAKRVAAFHKLWKLKHVHTVVDEKTNCIYSSSPLMRVFTICHEQLVQGFLRFKDEPLTTSEEIAVAVEAVKRSIESTIRRFDGVVKPNDGLELGYECCNELFSFASDFYGFQKGFGSDDDLTGLFFSEVGRAKAITDVLHEWGRYGVKTEPVGGERILEDRRVDYWKRNFDREKFRKSFAKLSHEERIGEIKSLESKCIKLSFKDPKTCFLYKSCPSRFGRGEFTRDFSYDFMLGYSTERSLTQSERRAEVDRVERSLFEIIAKHGGFVKMILRGVNDPCLNLQDSEDFLGDGVINALFPDDAARRRASAEVFEKLAVYGVSFPVEDGEELSVEEQIDKAHAERDSLRKELDSGWTCLKSDKESHREEAISIDNREAELFEKEIEFNELEKKIAERVKKLSLYREGLSELETQGEERMDDV